MAATETYTSIDVGTTKTCVTIAEIVEDGDIQVVGVGCAPSKGMRRGVVVNIDKATEVIVDALDLAEQMAGVKVRHAYVGIAGEHIRSLNSRGNITVSRGDTIGRSSVISDKDVDRVLDAARALALPIDRDVIHVLPQEFTIDDESGIRKPEGMTGLRLEAYVHVITAANAAVQNITRCVENAGVEVIDVILEPLASAHAVLSEDEKEYGVALLDMGGGTTDIAVYYNGSIRHSSVISLGGSMVTRDVAYVLGIPRETAEKLKVEKGGIYQPLVDTSQITVDNNGNQSNTEINPAQLNAIICARMEEIFEMALRELRRVDCLGLLASGVVLTGGASQLRGAALLAKEIFQRPVRIGKPRGMNGPSEAVYDPSRATGIGLILYALNGDNGISHNGNNSAGIGNLVHQFKGWFHELVS